MIDISDCKRFPLLLGESWQSFALSDFCRWIVNKIDPHKKWNRRPLLLGLLAALTVAQGAAEPWRAPTTIKRLPNGLTVVISQDHSAPTFGLSVSYGIGFRLEPEGRAGFAHLFEHMMFEGTPKAAKGVLPRVVETGGGSLNGHTRSDYTEYVETGPVSMLDPVLWLEADRMRTLDFSTKNLENQRQVVEEEVRVKVLNRAYGLFFAIDLPSYAFDTYPNGHNFYGDFRDLDSASIDDVQIFYNQYYAPNNAVLAVVGDISDNDVLAKIEKYFASIPARATPCRPNVDEPLQKAERRSIQADKLATLPALAVGYRMPPRHSLDALTGAVVGELLHNGQASRLYQALVKDKAVALSVDGGVNWPLGTAFDYAGPTLMTSFIVYSPNVPVDKLLGAFDGVIKDLVDAGPSQLELDRVVAKMRSDWYEQLETPMGRASALAHAVLFDGTFDSVYQIPEDLTSLKPAQIRAFAVKYLITANRTIINRIPEAVDQRPEKVHGADQ